MGDISKDYAYLESLAKEFNLPIEVVCTTALMIDGSELLMALEFISERAVAKGVIVNV